MSEVEIIATIYPKAGKADRLVELLGEMSQYVHANEPETLRYEMYREVNSKSGIEEIICFERYKSMDALKAHGSSERFREFQKTVKDEDLTGQPLSLKFVQGAGGFASRM